MSPGLPLRPGQVLRAGAVACAQAAAAGAAWADQIDRVLVNDSAEVAGYVAGLEAERIAAPPFRVKIGSQPATFKQGVEGVQLESLLVLTNPAGQPGAYTVLGEAAEAGKARGKVWTGPRPTAASAAGSATAGGLGRLPSGPPRTPT